MAGDWIKMRISLPRDGRIRFIAARTKAPIAHVCGALYFLWATADEQSTNGKLWGYNGEQLDGEVGINGFAEALTMLCDSAGKPSPWLELGDGFISIPEYAKHNGTTSKKRAQTALRASRLRSARSVTKRAPREEKRREDERREDNENKTLFADAEEYDTSPLGIDAIYDAYPRKVGKEAARRAIAKAVIAVRDRGQADPHIWLLERVKAFSESKAGRAGKFCPHPATWFNAGRYDDDQAEWDRSDRNGPARFEEVIEIREFMP